MDTPTSRSPRHSPLGRDGLALASPSTGPKSGSALSVPAFRYLWCNQLSFFFINNALRFLYGWVVLDGLQRDESAQGLMIFALGLPSIFLLLPAGVWADRLDRRLMLIGTQLGFAVVMAGTAIALGAGKAGFGLLLGSAFLAGAASAVGSPVRQSLVPEVLPPRLLVSGIAFGALAMTASLVFGPVTAELVGDRFGFDGAFWYLLVLVAIGLVALMPLEVPRVAAVGSDSRPGMAESLRAGMAFVWRHRAMRDLFLLLGVSGLIMSPIMFVTLQAFVKQELGRDAGDAAPLYALMGVGLAVSSFIVLRVGDMNNKGRVFTRAMLCGTAMLMLMGRATTYWQLAVLSLILGIAGGFFINMNQSLVQGNTPQDLMGRVMGLYTLVQAGLTPIGALALGFLAAQFGVGLVISLAAACGFATVLYVHAQGHELRTLA